MASGKSEDELLKEIAEKMAKNQISFDSKSEDEKKEFLWKIDMVASSQMVELQKSFNTLMGNIEGEIPENARIVVLEGIMNKVESEKLKSIDSAFLSEEVKGYASTVVTEIINNNEEKEDDDFSDEYLAAASILGEELNSEDNKINSPIEDNEINYSVDDIAENERNIDEIAGQLNSDEMDELIERANSGDVNARVEVIVLMSAMTFVETTVSIEEMTEIDKIKAIRSIDTLAELQEKLGSEKALILAEQLSKKWGVDFIIEDENGVKKIDRERIRNFAIENNIDYSKINIESLEKDTEYYENLDGYQDFLEEIKIDSTGLKLNAAISDILDKIRAGANPEDYKGLLKEYLALNFDATMRVINGNASSWSKNTLDNSNDKVLDNEAEIQFFILQEGIKMYEDVKNKRISGYIDPYVNEQLEGILDKSVLLMKNYKRQNKDLLDTMLRVAPKMTQQILNKTNFFDEIKKISTEPEHSPKIDKNERNRIRIDNLLKGLEKREKAKGIVDVIDFASDYIGLNIKEQTKRDFMEATLKLLENRENSYEKKERAARKRFFSAIISQKIYDEDILKTMVNMDSTTVKEMIDDLIERQNSKGNDELGTIMDLSSSLKQSLNSNVISADKAIPTLIEETSERNSIFERKDVVDKNTSKEQDDIAEER